jgi:FkbM family methyltransferase
MTRSSPQNPPAWEPPRSFEEKLRDVFVPQRLHLLHSLRRELRKGEHEIRMVPFLSDPERVALDIGANKGVWAEVMRHHAAAVHAFEPNPKMFRLLERGAASGVTVHSVALSNASGAAELRVPRGSRGYSNQGASLSPEKVGNGVYGAVTVEARKLDDMDLGDIGFMKVDVEGHELAVLEGARETLQRCRPNLIIEMEEKHTKRPIGEMIAEVCAYGYEAFALDGFLLRRVRAIDLLQRHSQVPPGGRYIFNWIFLPE